MHDACMHMQQQPRIVNFFCTLIFIKLVHVRFDWTLLWRPIINFLSKRQIKHRPRYIIHLIGLARNLSDRLIDSDLWRLNAWTLVESLVARFSLHRKVDRLAFSQCPNCVSCDLECVWLIYMKEWKRATTVSIVFEWESRRSDEINVGIVRWQRDKISRGRYHPLLILLWLQTSWHLHQLFVQGQPCLLTNVYMISFSDLCVATSSPARFSFPFRS